MSNARLTAVLMIAVCALLLVSDNGARIRADEKPKKANIKVKDITLVVPAAWKQEKPSNRLRLAQFQVPAIKGDKTGAELVISSFGFGGGGAEANIARWVKQFCVVDCTAGQVRLVAKQRRFGQALPEVDERIIDLPFELHDFAVALLQRLPHLSLRLASVAADLCRRLIIFMINCFTSALSS